MKKHTNILISTIFQNGGEATRALEIAKIIKAYQPPEYEVTITFLSHICPFDEMAVNAGFQVHHIKPHTKFTNFHDDFKTRFGELIGDADIAHDYLINEIKAYRELKPDIVIYGFWLIAGIATKMMQSNIKTIAFLPLPLTESYINEVTNFPDELLIARLPKIIQKNIIRALPKAMMLKNPALRHSVIAKSAIKLGWDKSKPLSNTFDMLRADTYLINDFPFFYRTQNYADNVIFTGPLYSQTLAPNNNDKHIIDFINANNNSHKKIFCSLGTSGNKEDLLEVIKAFNTKEAQSWQAIILSPPAICDIQTARSYLQNKNVYITDKFVNAKQINESVDMVICHGGQGTLQTAITSGTPLVGLATQPEQQMNLQHLSDFGMAERISFWDWKAENIKDRVIKILSTSSYKQRAIELNKISKTIETREIIGNSIWNMIKNND